MTGQQPTLDSLADILGHRFARTDLLREALTHPSVNPEDRGPAPFGYERLEFLGDRVLGLVIAEWLLELFPDEPEGALARRHAALVRRETLAQTAGAMALGDYLLLSSGEAGGGGRDNEAILANACEAVIGALYLDGGLAAAQRFIRKAWAAAVARYEHPPRDPKTALQEWAQARSLPLPTYIPVSRVGPDHDPVFTVEVKVDGHPPATGSGSSKRGAERAAAAALLALIDGP